MSLLKMQKSVNWTKRLLTSYKLKLAYFTTLQINLGDYYASPLILFLSYKKNILIQQNFSKKQ